MRSNTRLFLTLWVAGMAGVLSLLLVDISALVAALPQPAGTPPPELPPPVILKLVTILQPAVLALFAVLIGMWLAPKVGLHAPAAEAFAERRPFWPALKPQLLPGVLAGLASGVAIALTWVIAKPFLHSEFIGRAEEFNKLIPHAVRILYGGLTEEVLLRWGVMTFLVWMLWRLFQLISSSPVLGGVAAASADGVVKRRLLSPPPGILFVAAIVISAVVFGAGHLPIASALAGGLTLPIVLYVVIANSIFGIVAGFLYWRRGLESAMLAHMLAHVVLITAVYLAL